MATATIAKSEMRENHNLQSGYGEVPAFRDSKGEVIYVLPSGNFTKDTQLAKKAAEKLDKLIRAAIKLGKRQTLT